MKNIFVAFKLTGEDKNKVKATMKKVCSSFENQGDLYYCSILDDDAPREDNGKLFDYLFKKLSDADEVFVLMQSGSVSEGMSMEIGYAKAKGKKIILAIHKGVKNLKAKELADEVVEFTDLDDLIIKLNGEKTDE